MIIPANPVVWLNTPPLPGQSTAGFRQNAWDAHRTNTRRSGIAHGGLQYKLVLNEEGDWCDTIE